MTNTNSLAVNQLPYDCFSRSGWEESVSTSLQQASQEPGVAGIYLLVASPHGYEFQHLAVCRDGDDAEGSVWTNITGEKQTWIIHFPHDPPQSLERLQSPWQKRRVALGTERDPTRGRNVTLFIARHGQGSWLTCQTPLKDATKEDDLDALILDLQRIPNTRGGDSSEVSQ